MEQIPVTEARAQLSELVNRVGYGKERILLTRHGRPLVALVPAEAVAEPTAEDGTGSTVLDLSSQPGSYGAPLGIAAQDPRPPQA